MRDSTSERVILVFAGGVGLGAYSAGAYAALHERPDLRPEWVAGSSIGAVIAAIVAGNRPEVRIERLRELWAIGDEALAGARAEHGQVPGATWRHLQNWSNEIGRASCRERV